MSDQNPIDRNVLAIMLQHHIATYGPLPDDLGPDARAMLAGDPDALFRVALALAAREETPGG